MRIVVTGAAGFIASNLIPRLLDRGDEVVGIDNFFLGKLAYLQPIVDRSGFRFIEHDLLDLDEVIRVFAEFRPDRVWHLAANSDISYGTTYTDFDLKGGTIVTYNVLEAMRRGGVKELVFSSSGAVYGEPTVMPTPENYGPILPDLALRREQGRLRGAHHSVLSQLRHALLDLQVRQHRRPEPDPWSDPRFRASPE